ncbi:DUF5979 domain-containing protein [Nocardioides sp. CPCC 205120]|uniref:DUF5979 domain-containing protein n=1 Tax=Nocardioides sp. CPCC 205120 TaxID=3406462 RepID=UPI003B510A2A
MTVRSVLALLTMVLLVAPTGSAGAAWLQADDEPVATATGEAGSEPGGDQEPAQEPAQDPAAGEAEDPAEDPAQDPAPAQPRAAAAAAQAVVGISKENNLDGAALTPGGQFLYTLTVRCSGLTSGCVDQTVTDVLPEGLDVTSLPQTTDAREVTYDEATRRLTVRFTEPLQEPVGSHGLNDGATRSFDIGMRLPAGTSLADGTTIVNEATTVAANAPEVGASTEVVVSVPREVRPVATKGWQDGSAVAGTGEESTIVLGVRNASSSSADVRELTVSDVTAGTFEHFDLRTVEVTAFPAGADTARLLVCTSSTCDPEDPAASGGFVAGPATTGTGPLALPAGVAAADVTGFAVVFTDAAGATLPYDATGGRVEADVVLRDTLRSTGAQLRPTERLRVENCAVPAARDDAGVLTPGARVCAGYDVLPDTVVLSASKTYVADTDGDFARQNGEYAVVGERSPVSATVRVQNKSAFPLREIRITEPAASPASELDKLDVTDVRLRFPTGATSARLVVTYADGHVSDEVRTTGGAVDVERAGTRVTGIEVVYTGEGTDGQPSIAIDATAYLDLHGRLNDQVSAADLPNGTSPGVSNCASYEAAAGTRNGTGTAAGTACAALPVEARRESGSGVKSAGQTQVPPGQPIPFSFGLTNNGNVPLVQPVLADPPLDADGRPRAGESPFTVLRLTSVSASTTQTGLGTAVDLFDPQDDAWVAAAGADGATLARATGVRVRVLGELQPTKRVDVRLVTQRRDGVPDGVALRNCFRAGTATWQGDPACSAGLETAPANAAASLNKSIAPSSLVAPIPGVPAQTADLRLTVANTGNLSASRLQVTDADADFFDAVDVVRVESVTRPAGADRVRIDALTADGWVEGTPTGGNGPFPLPSGIEADEVVGLRATFSHSSGEARLTPCEGTPTPGSCTGAVVIEVQARQTLRSDAGTPVPDTLVNTATAGYETALQAPGTLAPLDPVEATLVFTEGSPQLDVDKTPDSAIAPGEPAPFRLTVTNSGTSDLPGLVVQDLMPAGLAFDESFAGDGGQPFRLVDTAVPAGTAPVPAPTFTLARDGDRVSGLRWTFGDWVMRPGSRFTLEIQVALAPGVSAGQVHTNTLGASAPVPGLACAPGTGTDTSGELGSGTWCTDTAAVTTKAGAAFQARKWVAGTDALGWYDNRAGEPVPFGAASCPSRTVEGRTYTAYPCVALVNPGDRYDYLMTMVNAGTEAATDMRVIDRFPVEGDKGVVLSGTDRGTQWENRPTLATAPRLVGEGVLATTYAHSEAGVCTDDLLMGTGDCAAGTWSDPFGPDAVAAQMRVHWDDPLQPGEGVMIAFSMTTPIDVPQVADPTIAWNSFGHAETTLRSNGQRRVLPPTEPIQVGVATAYGTLEVRKELGENPGGLPVGERTFGFAYECTTTPVGGSLLTVAEGTLSVRAGGSASVPGIPGGARCEVWETDAQGGVSSNPEGDPVVVDIVPQLGSTPAPATAVTVTNSFPLREIAVVKELAGDAAGFGADGTYEIEVTCVLDGVTATGFPRTVTLVGASRTTVPAPVGSTCTAVEGSDGGATSTTVAPADGVLVVPGVAASPELVVTNTFEAGRLAIVKHLDGAGASLPEGPFVFDVACTFDGRPITPVSVVLERDGAATELRGEVPGILPVGASCTVTESDSGGADTTPDPVTVVISENAEQNTVTATFVNEFSAGTVAVAKVLAGAGAEEAYATEVDFEVEVTCAIGQADQVVHSERVRLRGGERVELADAAGAPVLLPLGTRCWAEETETGGASAHEVSAGSFAEGVEVVAGSPDDLQVLDLEVTNTFDLADLRVDKVVTGEAAHYADGYAFGVEVTCVLPQDGVATPLLTQEPFTVRAGEPLVVEDLPVGAECWVAETDDGGATSSTVDAGGPADAAVLGPDGADVEVVNDFAAGTLTVAKRVVGGPAGPYTFAVACTTARGEVVLAPSDATLRLAHGEEREVVVPLGAECTVTEVDAPETATVSFEDSDGVHDGVVVASPAADVTVVNTFPADLGAGGEGAGDGAAGALPDTGGPQGGLLLLGGALLLAGAGVLLARRREGADA